MNIRKIIADSILRISIILIVILLIPVGILVALIRCIGYITDWIVRRVGEDTKAKRKNSTQSPHK